MFRFTDRLFVGATIILTGVACAEQSGSVPEVSVEEITAEVAELDAVHEVMEPMWHEAFPAQDFAAIQASVPEFEPLLSALDAATLPGILQDRQADWDEGKARLMESFQDLKGAANSGDEEGMLGSAEIFHMSYERLVRVIRPVVPELDLFHRNLYGVYHYYGPGYDLEKIRDGANRMAEAVPPLLGATLPTRLEDRQAEFEARVSDLGDRVAGLLMMLEDPVQEDVETAIEAVHEAYKAVENIFG